MTRDDVITLTVLGIWLGLAFTLAGLWVAANHVARRLNRRRLIGRGAPIRHLAHELVDECEHVLAREAGR